MTGRGRSCASAVVGCCNRQPLKLHTRISVTFGELLVFVRCRSLSVLCEAGMPSKCVSIFCDEFYFVHRCLRWWYKQSQQLGELGRQRQNGRVS